MLGAPLLPALITVLRGNSSLSQEGSDGKNILEVFLLFHLEDFQNISFCFGAIFWQCSKKPLPIFRVRSQSQVDQNSPSSTYRTCSIFFWCWCRIRRKRRRRRESSRRKVTETPIKIFRFL